MRHRFVKDFKEGEFIESLYLVRQKFFDVTKNGKPYISLEVSDKTGMVACRMWEAEKRLFDSFNVDDFVKVKGKIEIYRKYPQLNLDSLEKVEDSSVDTTLFIPTVDKNRETLLKTFLLEIDHVKNNYLKTLLNNIFSNKELISKFASAPAATDFHHPYIGGLLEHTLSCIELAKLVMSKYSGIDEDLLISSTALHDIGKIEELSYNRSFYYTDKGRLIGHIVIGLNMVEKEISKISSFPEQLKNLILHIILSHHGEQEWGSPKRPMCLEAVLLHHIDNLDAKINGFKQFTNTYNDPSSNWTKHSKMFREFLYKRTEVVNEEKEEKS